MARAKGDIEDIHPHTQPSDKAGGDLAAQTEIYPLIKTILNGIRDKSISGWGLVSSLPKVGG